MRFPIVLAATLAAALLVVACGDDSSSEPAPATEAPAAREVVEDDHAHEDDHADDHGDDAHMVASAEAGRIIVSDAESPYVSVIDLGTGFVARGAFEVAAPGATVYSGLDGRYAFVLSRGPGDADDRIHVFDSGIYTVPHGDHEDLVTDPVTRLLDIADELPIHYTSVNGWVAVFADSHGHVFLFEEEGLAAGRNGYEPRILEAGPHHGSAVALAGNRFIVSTKNPDNPEDPLPVGVEVRDLNDNVIYDASNRACPGLHGEAHSAPGVLFGCTGGVLLFQQDGDALSHVFFQNPEEMLENARVGTVYGHHDAGTFFVTASYRTEQGWGQDGLWHIDPSTGAFTRLMDESATASFGPEGERFFVFTADGVLHVFEADTGELVTKAALLGPGAEHRPAITFIGEDIVITDPANGLVKRVNLDTFSTVAQWEVGGKPSSVAYVGLTGHGH
ncbi:MAG: hypothetical protein F4081_07060 [Dehalococcoidia bacterium]|nr:hypothetical protein [Dehalococcoidia bacterium]MYI86531.1 hypothetical protein [Dehalococcoidia bacterium]